MPVPDRRIAPSASARLVLTNCDAFDEFPPAPFGLLVAAGRRAWRLKLLMGPMRLRPLRHSVLGFGRWSRKPLDPELTRALDHAGPHRQGRAPRRRPVHARRSASSDLLDVSTRLGEFAKPVLLVWGAADRFFKLSFAERLRDAFADARLVAVADGRTFLPLDDPERVADEIASLVRSA